MTKDELETYLHSHIPLAAAMQVYVINIENDSLTLGAPLAPNKNHRDTAFGGSVSTLATLAAWSFLRLRLDEQQAQTAHLVIQRHSMEYLLPITDGFSARAEFVQSSDWDRFEKAFASRGRARIVIGAVVNFEGRACARFSGDFVALSRPEKQV